MKRNICIVYAVLLMVGGTFAYAKTVDAATADELRVQIQQLLTQIAQLRSQIAQMQGQPVAWCHDFNTNLRFRNSGAEVKALQIALGNVPKDTQENTQEQNIFGEVTASAVVGFQEKYAAEILAPFGLQKGTGFVGTKTREKLNQLYGCKPVIPTPAPSPTLSPTPTLAPTLIPSPPPAGEPTPIPTTAPTVPDLIIEDITHDGEMIKVTYKNKGGKADGDFHIKLSTIEKTFTGETLSRILIPEEGESKVTSGWARSVVGLAKPDIKLVTAEIDWENRVTESDEANNIFSKTLIISGTNSTITVLSPNGGEKWVWGQNYQITWKAVLSSESVAIRLYDSGIKKYTLAESVPNIGSWTWSIPTPIFGSVPPIPIGEKYSIRVVNSLNTKDYDESDSYFTVSESVAQ